MYYQKHPTVYTQIDGTFKIPLLYCGFKPYISFFCICCSAESSVAAHSGVCEHNGHPADMARTKRSQAFLLLPGDSAAEHQDGAEFFNLQ